MSRSIAQPLQSLWQLWVYCCYSFKLVLWSFSHCVCMCVCCYLKEKRKGVCSVSIHSARSPRGLSRTLHGETGFRLWVEGVQWEDPWPPTRNGKHCCAPSQTQTQKWLTLHWMCTTKIQRSINRGIRGEMERKKIESMSGSLKDEAQNTISLCHWNQFSRRLAPAVAWTTMA